MKNREEFEALVRKKIESKTGERTQKHRIWQSVAATAAACFAILGIACLIMPYGQENIGRTNPLADGTTSETISLSEETTPVKEKKLINITRELPEDVAFPAVEEAFYEDDRYIYLFGYSISSYVIAEYSDGSTQNVKNALADGSITVADLDAFGIQYFTEPKQIEVIIDHTERGGLPTDDALEGFYTDDNYYYSFSSIRSQHIIVYYKDGTQQPIKEALADGKVTIRDLDWFGISYYKEPIEK